MEGLAGSRASHIAPTRKRRAQYLLRPLVTSAMLGLIAYLSPTQVLAHTVNECQGVMGTKCSQSEAYAALLPMPAAHCAAHNTGGVPRSLKINHSSDGRRYTVEFGCMFADGRVFAHEQMHYTLYSNKCQPGSSAFGCGKSVADLENSAKGETDPRHLFHAQQTCIAMKSCELRCQMENCRWMDNVIPDFTRPYLDGDGLWPQVEASCDGIRIALLGVTAGKWIADRQCFSTMGWYHVLVDLKGSLTKHGCGSQHDWNLVGQQIVPCLKETQPGYPQSYYRFGGFFVSLARDRVRTTCQERRSSQGLPLDINANISGKLCEVGP